MPPIDALPAFDGDMRTLHVLIETPKGSRNKFKYDDKRALFVLDGVLPAGSAFPYDFGFVPGTIGEDGDPLDVLVLMDEPVFCGCLVRARLIGAIEAEQTERDGTTMRNDRLVAVATVSHAQEELQALSDLSDVLVQEIEHFFVSYNDARGKTFMPLARSGPDRARQLVEEGQHRAGSG